MAVIASGASRLEVAGPASFDLRSWLFGWAPVALLVFGVWLVLNWAREKTTHASPVAAWYLLFSVATFPVGSDRNSDWRSGPRGYLPQWWSQGHWFAWAIYAALWVWLAHHDLACITSSHSFDARGREPALVRSRACRSSPAGNSTRKSGSPSNLDGRR